MPEQISQKDYPDRKKTEDAGIVRKPRVLFICIHNSVRSQIAEGYVRARYSDLFDVASAGSEPRGVHPLAVAVMDEIGIDISGQRSKSLDEFFHAGIDIVVRVCDGEHQTCPFFPGVKETIHAGFPDPSTGEETSGERIACFRQVRDAILTWIDQSFVPGYGQIRIRP
jgi:arsenate reductase (thioredoxin)